MVQPQRVLEMAHTFLEEVRRDLERVAAEGSDLPPRLRLVNHRQGQAAPELRTLALQVPEGAEGSSPEVLSGMIARYVADRPMTMLLLALEVIGTGEDGSPQPLLIAEVRERSGIRFFMMHPFRIQEGVVEWQEPLGDGWQDPGAEEMILDASFRR